MTDLDALVEQLKAKGRCILQDVQGELVPDNYFATAIGRLLPTLVEGQSYLQYTITVKVLPHANQT